MRTLCFVIVPYVFLLPLFLFPHSLSVVNFPLCMAAAPQGNSNTNFANFDAFGNTAIPSHQSTSSPSKSFSSGTTLPAIFPLHLIHMYAPLLQFFFIHLSPAVSSGPTRCIQECTLDARGFCWSLLLLLWLSRMSSCIYCAAFWSAWRPFRGCVHRQCPIV